MAITCSNLASAACIMGTKVFISANSSMVILPLYQFPADKLEDPIADWEDALAMRDNDHGFSTRLCCKS